MNDRKHLVSAEIDRLEELNHNSRFFGWVELHIMKTVHLLQGSHLDKFFPGGRVARREQFLVGFPSCGVFGSDLDRTAAIALVDAVHYCHELFLAVVRNRELLRKEWKCCRGRCCRYQSADNNSCFFVFVACPKE